MSKRLFVTSVFLLMAFACSMASASVTYSYSGGQGTSGLNGLSFQFTLPSLLTPMVGTPPFDSPQVTVGSLTSFTFPTTSFLGINLFTLPGTPGFTLPPPADGIAFDQPGQLNFVYFPLGTLGTYGVTSQIFFGSGTLTITQSTIPEPSSLLLLASGCVGLLGAARRKFMI